MMALLRLLGLAPQPDARAAALDAQCELLLELMRRHPDRAAAMGRSFAACGVTAEEAARAFGKMGALTTRQESVV
jgi:hypothetical protein